MILYTDVNFLTLWQQYQVWLAGVGISKLIRCQHFESKTHIRSYFFVGRCQIESVWISISSIIRIIIIIVSDQLVPFLNWYWSWYQNSDILIFGFCKMQYRCFTIFSKRYEIFDLVTNPSVQLSLLFIL